MTIFILLNTFLFAQNDHNEMYVISGDGLNLRTAPSISSQKIKTLPFGSKVTVISVSKDRVKIDNISSFWFQVQCETNIGWVF